MMEPQMTQSGSAATEVEPANHANEKSLLGFGESFPESFGGTSPCRFGSEQARAEKRCEHAHPKKPTVS
jgi:hypothetical protein